MEPWQSQNTLAAAGCCGSIRARREESDEDRRLCLFRLHWLNKRGNPIQCDEYRELYLLILFVSWKPYLSGFRGFPVSRFLWFDTRLTPFSVLCVISEVHRQSIYPGKLILNPGTVSDMVIHLHCDVNVCVSHQVLQYLYVHPVFRHPGTECVPHGVR